jgi:hypothetical protein
MKATEISGPKTHNKSKVSNYSQIPINQFSHRTKRMVFILLKGIDYRRYYQQYR